MDDNMKIEWWEHMEYDILMFKNEDWYDQEPIPIQPWKIKINT